MLITERLYVPDDVDAGVLFGVNRGNLILLRTLYPKLRLVAGDNVLKILGEASQIDDFVKVLDHLSAHIRRYNSLNEDAIRRIARGEDASTPEPEYHIVYGARGKSIAARGANQQRMLRTFEEKDLLFAVGPAGTGKTFVAIALAVKALKERKIRRIILSRPAVEAGEKLGFLPGEMKDKLDPYLQPLYDALEEMIPPPRLKEYMEQGTIQIAPLAYMRGRTLNDAVVILDEAQNTTTHQMKMFLTRMGYYSKMIVTGDVTQIDLPRGVKSGLKHALEVLSGIPAIGRITFEKGDIVRHPLVQQIVEAYDAKAREEQEEEKKEPLINRDTDSL